MLNKKENFDLTFLLGTPLLTQDEFDILFCSKEDWFIINDSGKQDWSISFEKQNFFWNTFEKIKSLFEDEDAIFLSDIDSYNFSFIKFPPIYIYNSVMRKVAFNDQLSAFPEGKKINFYKAMFYGNFFVINSLFDTSLNFEESIFYGNTMFKNVVFEQKEVFKKSIFKQAVTFDNVDFNDITIFKNTIFENNAKFRGVSFNEWASFNSISSYKELDFTYSRSEDFIDFSNSNINNIDLEHTRFNSAGFLNLNGLNVHKEISVLNKSNFANKESARLIKAHFEKENNITEANKYFQIEQDLYIEQLKTEKTADNNKWKNLFVLYLNKYVSYFGTDWVRPLLVIFSFGYLSSLVYGFLQMGTEDINFINSKPLLLGGFVYSIFVYYLYHKKLMVGLIASIVVFFSILMDNPNLIEMSNDISKLINPLNIFKPKANYFVNITMYGMLVKFGMSVLIYQFIMAFRQNTRRK